jgi:N-acetylglucosaminyldiphosphoundecaprenol N-acetyl-beta-D-mannosaminyltransferase
MELLKTKVFDYDVYSGELNAIKLTQSKVVINTINAYSYIIAKSDPIFKESLQKADILMPDGFPIVIAARLQRGKKIKKIAGADIFFHLCQLLNESRGNCFFLGSSNEVLSGIEDKLSKEFPNLKSGFYSPPYKKEFSDDDNAMMIAAINAFKPDVAFIGMTAPKQEKWVLQNYQSMDAGIICSIGAVFDFYSGSVTRPSAFWINLKLEWFIRLIKEPRRLWRRYLVYSPLFFIDLFLSKIGIQR